MKAVVTTGERRKVVVKDIPKPQVQPGTLLLKTKYCSICGTDLEYLDGDFEYLESFPGFQFPGHIIKKSEPTKIIIAGKQNAFQIPPY